MFPTRLSSLLFGVAAIGVVCSRAAAQEQEPVAFRTAQRTYITGIPNSLFDLSGTKIGTRTRFWLLDLNGGERADGDKVNIIARAGEGDAEKISYWSMKGEELKRGGKQEVITLKKTDAGWALQMADGRFLVPPASDGDQIAFTDSVDEALSVEIVDAPE